MHRRRESIVLLPLEFSRETVLAEILTRFGGRPEQFQRPLLANRCLRGCTLTPPAIFFIAQQLSPIQQLHRRFTAAKIVVIKANVQPVVTPPATDSTPARYS